MGFFSQNLLCIYTCACVYTQPLKCEEAVKQKIKIVPALVWSLAQMLSRRSSQSKLFCNFEVVMDSAKSFWQQFLC